MIAATYLLGRNPEYYPDPLEVKPERWIRNTGNKKVHSFAWLPFGYGTRMCIGQYKGFNMVSSLLHYRGCLHGLAVACWTTNHYHPCLKLGVGISEDCFIFDFASLPLEVAQLI